MIQMKAQQMIAFVFSAVFMLASAGVFAGDYQQEQNVIIDPNERNTKQLNLQSDSSSQGQSNQGQKESGSSSQGQNKSEGMSSGNSSSDKEKKSNY